MEFKEIIKELARGKKIKRKHWKGDYFLKRGNNIVLDCFDKPFIFKTSSFFGQDWEIFKEKKEKIIILDNNELSIMEYAKEFPENWVRICKALEKKEKRK